MCIFLDIYISSVASRAKPCKTFKEVICSFIIYIWIYYVKLVTTLFNVLIYPSAMPEVRGTADVDGGAYLPYFRSLVRPHDYHYSGLRTDGQGRTERVIEREHYLRTNLTQFVSMGVLYVAGPKRPAHSAPNVNYHLLGW